MKRGLTIQHSGPRVSLIAAAILAAAASPAFANTWIVATDGSGDFTSVQSAITAAQSGDSVLVGPGTYIENIRFAGRDIVLKSIAGPEVTILDGSSQPRSVVEFMMGESNACLIEGFTITGGSGSGVFQGERNGGGIWIQDAEPSIVGNIIENNHVTSGTFSGLGGGIYCRAGLPDNNKPVRRPKIVHNIIRLNTANGNGGGIGLQEKTSGEIRENVISDNKTRTGDGAGIWILVRQISVMEIIGNNVTRNDAGDHGGGVYASNLFHATTPALPILILSNLITRNLARGQELFGDSGGGIWLDCTDAHIVSNTIVANQGQGPGNSYGGGIVLRDMGHPTIEKNIIALTVQGGGVLCHDGVEPSFRNNLFWANDGGDGRGSCANLIGLEGNIGVDPLFCGAASYDFSLPPNSPALTHPIGPLGAIISPGCATGVNVISTTWTRIKAILPFKR